MSWPWWSDPGPRSRLQHALGWRSNATAPARGLAGPSQPGLARLDQLLPLRVSKRTVDYLGQFTWNRVLRWLRRKHPRASWGWLRRRYLPRWWPTHGKTTLLRCGQVTVRRYRY